MASNLSAQTRGLSAADWTRLQRLRGARSYLTTVASNNDINVSTVPQTPYNPALLIPRQVGASRIRRSTSDWISYVGSQTSDYILQTGTNTNGNVLTRTRLCDCSTSAVNIKIPGCYKCSVYIHKTIQ